MLRSIDIKNYRNLKEFRISSLGKVNLFTGKNNTGKSTLLEAIAIYATKGDFAFLNQLIADRGETFRQLETNKNPTQVNIRALSSMFTGRIVEFGKTDAISIGIVENTLFGEEQVTEKSLSLRFVKYFEEVQKDPQVTISRSRIMQEEEADKQLVNYKVGFEIKTGTSSFLIPLDEDRPFRYSYKPMGNNENVQFIRTRNIDRDINGRLWDNITLTEKELNVIEALKIIEPNTERIAFIEESSRERNAVIKLSNNNNVVPLKSMGDGINRILTIILALVNADNGFLLIDEFENGLHHTVQEQLWNIIFNLSQKLNIQVFVTTHSNDCILGFQDVLNRPENILLGKLIRLDNENGIIKQVQFDAKELKIASDNDIEVR
jgi:AAA15 family ATPase/GTPase